MRLFRLAVIALVFTSACSGTILGGDANANRPGGRADGGPGAGDAPSGGSGPDGGTSSPGSDGGVGNGGASASCSPSEAVPEFNPIRRLTTSEYNNTLRDLFPGVSLERQEIAQDTVVDGFDNNAAGQVPSPLVIEQYRSAALAVSEVVFDDLSSWAPCDDTGDGGCAEEIAFTLAERAFRRPLTEDERSTLAEFATSAFDDYGFEVAVRMSVEAILQLPQFLYRPELGSGDSMLTGYEIASRLSYLLWRTMPDTALLQAAAAGELDTEDGIRAQAQRLLDDDRAKETVADFHMQWFMLQRLDQFTPDTALYPEYTPDVRDALIESTSRFLEYVFWDVGSVEALFTDRTVFANDALAEVYGLESPGTDELVPIEAPATERAGILTQPGLLASSSHTRVHAPILRGVFIRTAVLCTPVPPPPAAVNVAQAQAVEDRPRTTREHIEETHVKEECAGCHNAIDGIGFAFENYDTIGRFVTEENGLPIDPSGELVGIPGIADTEVEDAVALAELVASTQQAHDCVASHWFRYALGRSEDDDGARCAVERLGVELAANGGDMKAMLLSLITSDAFRRRPEL